MFAVIIAGCEQTRRTPAPETPAPRAGQVAFELRLAQDTPAGDLVPMTTPRQETVYARRTPDLTGADVDGASTVELADGRRALAVRFTPDGGKRLAELTTANPQKRIVFLLDEQVVSAPWISGPITGGSAVIDGDFDDEELQRLTGLLSRE